MPSVSEKQKRFMDAAAHNPQFAKAAGVPVSVAKDFSESSKGMKFGKDTDMSRADLQKINKLKTLHGTSFRLYSRPVKGSVTPFLALTTSSMVLIIPGIKELLRK